MDVQLIECKLIEFPKTDSELRSFNKEFATNLAASIRAEGMYNPITVRPNLNKPGLYLGVQGRHRHYAKTKVLKETVIECVVINDMDDAEAEMATIAENLWRNPLTKTQHLKAIKKWWEHYAARNPEKVGQGAAGTAAIKKKAAERKAAEAKAAEPTEPNGDDSRLSLSLDEKDRNEPARPAPAEPAEEKAGGNFAETVAAATGQSVASAKRSAKLAKTFDADQLEVFDQMKVSQTDMLTVAKIKDDRQRGEVVSLIASGMEPADAIKEVMRDTAPARDNGQGKADTEAKTAARQEREPELSDDDWFAKYCGEKSRFLADPAKYKADALLFRKVSEPRHAFRAKVKRAVADAKKAGVVNLFYFAVNRLISFSHPKDWLLCDDCKGQGKAAGAACKKCNGGGYLLKTEQYL